jgi:hypothetical protein
MKKVLSSSRDLQTQRLGGLGLVAKKSVERWEKVIASSRYSPVFYVVLQRQRASRTVNFHEGFQ